MLRLLLTCLLVIAVPMKTMAAVTMTGCSPVHRAAASFERLTPVVASTAHVGVHDSQAGVASGGAHHGAAMTPVEPDANAAADGSAGGLPASAKCTGCAPCCAAAAPASEVQRFQSLRPLSGSVPFAIESGVGIDADVPLKPPRPVLA